MAGWMSLTDRSLARETRESVLHSACTRFSTVLGPGSDWYHEDHVHLDVMERRNNYRICQWNVWDPLPQIAPLLPAGRPEEAPPREVAEKSDAKKEEFRQIRRCGEGRKPSREHGQIRNRKSGQQKSAGEPAPLPCHLSLYKHWICFGRPDPLPDHAVCGRDYCIIGPLLPPCSAILEL